MKVVIQAAAFVILGAASAHADSLIGSYVAYIGDDDLYNSSDERLSQPWQVLRQDRANYHKFGISQPGDQDDDFFASAANRERMEAMVRSGDIEPSAARAVMNGHALVLVKIYGRGAMGRRLVVQVYE